MRVLTCVAAGYASLCTAVWCSPGLQRLLTYCHWARTPYLTYWLPPSELTWANLRDLTLFRLGGYARNVTLHTADGETIYGWHLAPSRLAPMVAQQGASREAFLDQALSDTSTQALLYLHGQAGSRGVCNRVECAKALASQLQCHVIIIDYRGFGDSSGSPSQAGLIEDAATAWRWIMARRGGALIYGQSLGSAVAVQLARRLGPELKGLVLDVPFTSSRAAALRHPLAAIFRFVPWIRDAMLRGMADTWDSAAAVGQLACPILFFGAGRDKIVGPGGAKALHDLAVASTSKTLVQAECAGHSNVFAFDDWLVGMAKFLEVVG